MGLRIASVVAIPYQRRCRRSSHWRDAARGGLERTLDQSTQEPKHTALKGTVAIVAALNFGYFFVEFSIAVAIASVALFADSIDFLEDATINMLVLVALGWTAARRRLAGLFLAVCLLVPGLAALYTAWEKFNAPSIPDATLLTLAGLGALAVNAFCALLLSQVRHQGGSLSLAAFLSARNDVAARTRFLGIMAAQAQRMNRILDDLLSLSRIEMRAHVRPEGPVDMSDLIAQVIRGLEPLALKADISLRFTLISEAAIVRGDRDELEQVMQNLIHNAIKYGRPAGSVDVSLRERTRGAAKRGALEVTVTDDGLGIAPEHLPRLTERFYRVDTARSREQGGTGLGLAIVKHILNRHRGELNISSEVGRGSRFTVVLETLKT